MPAEYISYRIERLRNSENFLPTASELKLFPNYIKADINE
jgi:hypothetical protein